MSSKYYFLYWLVCSGLFSKAGIIRGRKKHYVRITAGISLERFSFLLPVIYITVMLRVLAILLNAAQMYCDILCAEDINKQKVKGRRGHHE